MRYSRILISCLISVICSIGYSQDSSLSLSKAIKKALDRNYGISISRADLNIAEINNNWGNAGKYPTISFGAGLNNSYNIADESLSNGLTASLGMNWILFDGFRVNITKSILENTEALSSGSLSIAVENTIEEVILGYYGVILEEKRLEVLKTVLDLSKDRYSYEIQKKSLGSAVTYEVLLAENVYLSDKAAFLEQEMRVRNARRNFNFILAEEEVSQWIFSEDLKGDSSRFVLSDLQNKMLTNNQTLKNQYVNLLMKEDETRMKQAGFSPTISIAAGMDNSIAFTNGPGNESSSQRFAPYANLRLSYDIYKGGIRKRALETAKINEEIADTEIEQMEHALKNELYNLFDYHEVRIKLLDVATKSQNAAELNLKISEEKYKTGVINSFNYRDVQLIYIEAALRKLQAEFNLIDSKTSLTRITGGFLQVEE